MNIAFYFKNLEPTEALKEYTDEKLSKFQNRFHHIESIRVSFFIEKQNQFCELNILADSHVFHIEKNNKDLYAAIDEVIDTLNVQIDKYHKKLDSRSLPLEAMPQVNVPEEDDKELIINVYTALPKPMTEQEAILQIQAQRFRFLIFHRSNEQKYSFAFVRPDGNYSIISPTSEIGQYEEHIVKLEDTNIKELSVSLYPMSKFSIPEAIETLKENNLEFFNYVNEESNRMNVLFYTKHGDLALKKPLL